MQVTIEEQIAAVRMATRDLNRDIHRLKNEPDKADVVADMQEQRDRLDAVVATLNSLRKLQEAKEQLGL